MNAATPSHVPLICITGPTASGKSAAMPALAERWPVEIINMDSATIYTGMDIGTAKPTAAERARIAHHLLDIRDPAQTYSAAAFAHDAAQLVHAIRARGHIPVLCGGTLLYYRALRVGLNAMPASDPALRAQIDAEARERGWPALHAELARVDPPTAARLAPHDRQRIQRALEVWRQSARPLSAWQAEPPQPPLPDARFITLSLEPAERSWLHARIARRLDAMLAAGFLDEVRALFARPDLHLDLPSIRCVCYRQFWMHLQGRSTHDEAREQALAATRQLAKRQFTWLRALPQRVRVDCQAADATARVVDAFARALHPAPRV